MEYSRIRTLKDYVAAVSILAQDTHADDYTSRVQELSRFAEQTVFRAVRLQLTGAGHRNYRVDFSELVERVRKTDKYIPVLLLDPIQGYEFGNRVNVPLAGHLDDVVAA